MVMARFCVDAAVGMDPGADAVIYCCPSRSELEYGFRLAWKGKHRCQAAAQRPGFCFNVFASPCGIQLLQAYFSIDLSVPLQPLRLHLTQPRPPQ